MVLRYFAADSVSFSTPRAPALSKEDCAELARHLDACMATFERRTGALTAAEVRMKSMISVLRNEVRQHAPLHDAEGEAGRTAN